MEAQSLRFSTFLTALKTLTVVYLRIVWRITVGMTLGLARVTTPVISDDDSGEASIVIETPTHVIEFRSTRKEPLE